VVIDSSLTEDSPTIATLSGPTLDALIERAASSFVGDRSGSAPASGHSGGGERPEPAPSAPPRLPEPRNPWTPFNVAPGGVGGGSSGGSPVGVLVALIALLAFGARLGGVLPVNVAPLRAPALAFHLKRPG
jgi:hypothetical protein